MSNIQNFIINNIGLIITIIAAILGLGKAIISKNKQQVYANIYALVSDAEQLSNTTGADKFNYVFDLSYNKLPAILKLFISKDDIKRAIEFSLNKLKAFAKLECENTSTETVSDKAEINTNIQTGATIAADITQNTTTQVVSQ